MLETMTEGSFLEMWFVPDFSGKKWRPVQTEGTGSIWESPPVLNWRIWASDEVRQSFKKS